MAFECKVYGAVPSSPITPCAEINSFFWEKEGYSRPKIRFCFYGIEGKGLCARFTVCEEDILARFTQRDAPCWRDSCCEVFTAPFSDDTRYINFEINPNGAYLSEFGNGREGRVLLSELTDVQPTVTACINGASWECEIFIPDRLIREVFGREDFETRPGITLRGNFYKCADDSPSPHYGAYFPVDDSVCGFHNPGAFGQIILRGSEEMSIENVAKAFGFEKLVDYAQVGKGHIHATYGITVIENGESKRYLLQQINTYVFKNPAELMDNIKGVTTFLAEKIKAAGGDASRETLHVYDTVDGKSFYIDDEGGYWRCYNFIEDAYSLEEIKSPDEFYRSAKAFGTFQKLLADYPINSLHETIVNFHNTVSRFADFRKALEENVSGRAGTAKEETEFILAREKDCAILVDMLAEGKLPLRVTHNDTKLNNVMFDKATDDALCVVDLDTVMPGLSLYDFGDAIRYGANTAAEDEKDLSKVSFSTERFEAYVKGYLEAAGDALTDAEIELLPLGSKLMTLECGMRFLGDYFNGNVYFRCDYPEHNLVRARTQIALVADMEKKADEMAAIVAECRKELGL